MTRPPRGARPAVLLVVALALGACRDTPTTAPATTAPASTGTGGGAAGGTTSAGTAPTTTSASPAGPATVVTLRAEVVRERPRDPSGFTQGLELDGGVRYESNGLYGSSVVRTIDHATGEVLRSFSPPSNVFAEGITKVQGLLVLLTWRERRAYLLDATTLTRIAELPYDAEGWGICARGDEVVTSDGSDTLTFRDPRTLEARRRIAVRLRGEPVRELNELECVGDEVWANVWRTDRIVRIRVADGAVTAVADLPELRPAATRADADAVLNGIAHDARSGTFLVTGKRWPVLYEVRFVPREGF